jgi:hypothetical protein
VEGLKFIFIEIETFNFLHSQVVVVSTGVGRPLGLENQSNRNGQRDATA